MNSSKSIVPSARPPYFAFVGISRVQKFVDSPFMNRRNRGRIHTERGGRDGIFPAQRSGKKRLRRFEVVNNGE